MPQMNCRPSGRKYRPEGSTTSGQSDSSSRQSKTKTQRLREDTGGSTPASAGTPRALGPAALTTMPQSQRRATARVKGVTRRSRATSAAATDRKTVGYEKHGVGGVDTRGSRNNNKKKK